MALLIPLLLVVAAIASPARAQIYRWVDASGSTHFGDTPPATGNAKIGVVPTTSPTAPAPPASSWEDKERDFRRRQIEQSETQAADDKKAMRRCEEARNRVARLRAAEGNPTYRVDGNGGKTYIGDDERALLEKNAQQAIAVNCRR